MARLPLTIAEKEARGTREKHMDPRPRDLAEIREEIADALEVEREALNPAFKVQREAMTAIKNIKRFLVLLREEEQIAQRAEKPEHNEFEGLD